MLLGAMLAMVLAAAAPALAQDESNAALVNCQQILQQIGGDQYAGAVGGDGEGDTAAANEQEFSAEQIQQCIAIAGDNNAAAANVGDVTVPAAPAPDDNGGGGGDDGNGGGGDNGGASNGGGSGDDSNGGGGGLAVLPDTGGFPLPALLAGVALISFGILARRLAR